MPPRSNRPKFKIVGRSVCRTTTKRRPTKPPRLNLVTCEEEKRKPWQVPNTTNAQVIEIPADLPQNFFDELIFYAKNQLKLRYTGLYWEPMLDRLLITDGQSLRFSPNEWVYICVVNYEPILEWIRKSKINLGSSYRAASRWMIVDFDMSKSYAVVTDIARKWLQQQKEPAKLMPRRGN